MSSVDRRIIMGEVGQLGVVTEGNFGSPAMTRQRGLIGVDQVLAWALDGRLFQTQQGDAATLVNFAETAYDEDQPQFALRVPAGRTVVPLSLIVTLQDMAGTDTHIVWSRTTNDIGNGTSTAAVITALRTDAPYSSGCTARSLYTGDATAATGLIEFARFFDAFADAATGAVPRFEWNALLAGFVPILVGPATLQAHIVATGTAPQGFGEYIFAEFETPNLLNG